ncbi:MAG: thymidine phosphorylase [Ignavibacteria bacterium]|nr:thymidine phosphorylase [Ignavibacteria bacterium]
MKSTKELLREKRDGREWSADEIAWFVDGLVNNAVSSGQVAAFLMAACTRGLTPAETAALTISMSRSGDMVPTGRTNRPIIDKHSTGGVGDKTSLLLAPLAKVCGLAVPMISGRGLGHTGGTLDKLESVTGFNVNLSLEQMSMLLNEHHLFMAGQTPNLVPADRVMYALRDVTGTVESISLMTASILSKKLAENLDGLVMNMTVGRGAFLTTIEESKRLAESMQNICNLVGLPTTFVFSRMDRPLGRSVGNWLEMVEAEAALAGVGDRNLVGLTTELVQQMLLLSDSSRTQESARERVAQAWRSGEAHQEFHAMIARQGGDWHASMDRHARCSFVDITSSSTGFVPDMHAREIAVAAMQAGAGRLRETDPIDHSAGVVLYVEPGQAVESEQPLARVYAHDHDRLETFATSMRNMLKTNAAPVEQPPLIIEVWS